MREQQFAGLLNLSLVTKDFSVVVVFLDCPKRLLPEVKREDLASCWLLFGIYVDGALGHLPPS